MLLITAAFLTEVEALINSYQLKQKRQSPFLLYQNEETALVITGKGAENVSAAVGWLFGLFPSAKAVLNYGTAGAKDEPVGKGFLIEKIIEEKSKKALYPHIGLSLPSKTLLTLDSVQNSYPDRLLIDMEGAPFFRTALKFVTIERIALYKIVSDTSDSPFDKKRVPSLFSCCREDLNSLICFLSALPEEKEREIPAAFERFSMSWAERERLKQLLAKLDALQISWEVDLSDQKIGDFIERLQKRLL